MKHRKRPAREKPLAIAYSRVSTEGQANNGYSLAAQEADIRSEIKRRGWKLLELVTDAGLSAKEMRKRPNLLAALDRLAQGEADVLLVAKLDRLSRNVVNFGDMLERARRESWALVALDLGVDTSTSVGELVANVMMSVAQWERRAIGERTKRDLAQARAEGVRLGRPPSLDPTVRARIRRLRTRGWSLQAIADRLNEESVPTAQGGTAWRPSSIAAALRTATPKPGLVRRRAEAAMREHLDK